LLGSAPASGAVFRALAENIGRIEISNRKVEPLLKTSKRHRQRRGGGWFFKHSRAGRHFQERSALRRHTANPRQAPKTEAHRSAKGQ